MQWWSCSCLTLVLTLIITCIESSLLLFFYSCLCDLLRLSNTAPPFPWLSTPAPERGSVCCICTPCIGVCVREEHVGASNCTVERASGHVRVSLRGGVKQHPSLLTFFALCVSLGCKIHVRRTAPPPTHTHGRTPVVIPGFKYICIHVITASGTVVKFTPLITEVAGGECVLC